MVTTHQQNSLSDEHPRLEPIFSRPPKHCERCSHDVLRLPTFITSLTTPSSTALFTTTMALQKRKRNHENLSSSPLDAGRIYQVSATPISLPRASLELEFKGLRAILDEI